MAPFKVLHSDAAAVSFLSEQLLALDPRIYPIIFADPKYQQFIPVDNMLPPGADTVGYDVYESFGVAAWYTGTGEDLPLVNVTKKRVTSPIKPFGVKASYTDDDLEKAAFERQLLESRGVESPVTLTEAQDVGAAMAVSQFHERAAVVGDETLGILGVTNQPNINNYTIPAGATSGATLWSGKTDDEILADLNDVVAFTVNATKNTESLAPNAMLLPLARYNYIAGRRLTGDANGKTLLSWFVENNPYVKDVKPWAQLDNKGPGGTAFGLVYRRDPMVLKYRTGKQFERKPPERKGLGYIVYSVANTGGVTCQYPVAVTKFTSF